MEFEQRESGFVVPKEKPKPERKYGLLEFQHEDNRESAREALQRLFLLTACRGIEVPDRKRAVQESRRRLVESLAVELLGEDVEFWEYT